MATKRPWHTAALMALGWLAGFSAIALNSSIVNAGEIRDEAGFFSPSALSSAQESLKQIEARDKVTINIETHSTIPASKQAAFKALPKSEWSTFYRSWIQELVRGDKAKSKGVFVLITKTPGHLEFAVPAELKQRGFNSSLQTGFSSKLLEDFRNKQFDQGLVSAVGYLNTVTPTLKPAAVKSAYNPRPVRWANQPANRPQSLNGQQAEREDGAVIPAQQPVRHANSWGIWNWVILGGVVWLVFIVISSLIRSFSGGAGGGQGVGGYGSPAYGSPGYGGGGFMSNMLGGLAGAMAGNWLYNSMFSGHSSAHGADWSGSSDQGLTGNDYSGGDFGDSGGDFGGGDFGGGDFDGGDFGGGDF